MKIVYLNGQKDSKPAKKSNKELESEKARLWMEKQKAKDAKKAIRFFSKEIEEIRKRNPDFKL